MEMIILYNDIQKRATEKYKKAHYKRIPLDVPVEFYEQVKDYAKKRGYSVNGLIRELLTEKMKTD